MKKITLLLLLTILFSSISYAQKGSSYENAMYYLREKGEVILTFKANSKQQLQELTRVVSISHKHVDQNLLEVEAYANKKQFERFLTYGIPYKVTQEDNEIPQEFTNGTQAVGAWDTTWDAYPKYSEYVAKMNYWATTYPNLCTLQNIGSVGNGRALYVLKISDNASTDETEPEFLYTSSMHGDEITGYPTMLRFIDYLLTNYGTLSEVTNLVNGTELYICPLANPNGSYRSNGNDTYNSSGNAAIRGNANGIDLNRNYPDAIGGLHDDGEVYQTETNHFLNFQATRNFVLSANYHGGTEVVNFPLDTSYTPGTGNFSYHPHDNYFKFVSTEYAQLCQTADGNADYMDAVYNTGQFPGTTNGAAWYSVYGGRQDASNYFEHNKEITIEISNLKTPAAANLPFFWVRNRQALLNYVKQASYGLHGTVVDQFGNPIHAKVYVGGTVDNFGSWVETSPTNGDYHKVQIAGTYNVIFEAQGYVTQTIPVTLTNNATTTLNVTMVRATLVPGALDTQTCNGGTATLTASESGTIRWFSSPTSTTVLATGSYTTPILTANTSYWVEREFAPANIGPATVTGTATANATVANKYLIFSCTTPTKLKSVMINASGVGQLFVELQNSAGVMLESKVIRLTAAGAQDINLDFFIPVGTNLRLVSREISATNLTCATSGITYPMTNGTVSITGNSGTGTFFQFFNWKFGTEKSLRDEVVVTMRPAMTTSTISPTAVVANSGAFTLTVNGNNFVNGESIIRWNGVNRTTTYVSPTQLTASIPAGDVTTAGTANVTVFNTCNSTNTTALTFTISNCSAPVPTVATLPTVTGQCNATVTGTPTATSNCAGTITGTTNSPLSYTTQGTFTVVWTYNDGNGNTVTQNQTVIVDDTIAPVPTVASLPTITGQCSATVSTTPTANDTCVGTVTATTNSPLTYSTQGTFTVVWTYNDGNGNTVTQNQTVIVDDTIAPVPTVASLPTITGQCSATVSTTPTANDTCVGTVTATTNSPLSYSTQGTFTVVWTYNDGNGNTVTQNQTVIVDDTIAPVPTVASLPTITGQCSATVSTTPTANDTCVGTVTATTNSPLSYSTQGTFTVVWTYNDGNGNTVTQNQTVIVDDTIAPVPTVASLPTITGQCSATVSTTPTANDTCVGTVTATTNSPLSYSTQGTFTVVWTYNDGNGNTVTQNQTVIVDDTIAPVPTVASLPTITGQCSATVSTTPTANDTCVGTVTATTNSPLSYSTQGTFTVVWTYNDGNGNTVTQNQTVIVDDTIAPVPTVASLPTITGQCSATVSTTPTANDTCVGTVTATTNSPLTYSTQGTFTVVWTYNDGNGNTVTQNQTVIVDDTIAPVPTVASLPTITGQCSATVSTTPTANDTCVGTVTATTNSPLSYSTQGTFTVVWTYNDGNGNTVTQNQTVIVDDTIAPVPTVASLPTITGQCSATVSTTPTANDACAGTINATTTSPLTYNTEGTYAIVWTYNDGNGNTVTQNQTVIVDDTIAPVPTVASLPTITGQCSATVSTTPTANDTCVGTVTATTNSPLTYSTQGTFTVVWTYNDGNGNTVTQNQTVIVDDTIAPVPTVASLPTITGQCSATVSTTPTANDTCVGTVTATTNSPLSYSTQGTFTVVWTYNDGNGNTVTQNQTVIVDDTIAPVPTVASLPTITGQCSATVSTTPTANDTCVGTVTATTNSPLSYSTQGTFTVVWTYNDGNGNTVTQNQTVIVDDTIAPVPTVASLPTITGQCSATVSTTPTANDACAGTINATTTSPLTYNTEGTYAIVWTYNDGNGNTVTQNQTVIVDDTIAPVPDVASLPNATGECSVVVSSPTATDNCLGSVTATTTDPLSYNEQGTYQITWTYDDGNGNTSTQTQTVIVTSGGNVIIYYLDNDGDGFGNPNSFIQSCAQPEGYVLDNSDCDDNLLTYADNDNDGFGSDVLAPCGVTNSDDCNDNLLTYVDADNDGFGSDTLAPCGVSNSDDCNDNLLTYFDADNDGFGSDTLAPCGVSNSDDCNDNLLTYVDADNDGFGSDTLAPCGVSNSDDCNDNLLTYADNDNDGFGSDVLAPCGVTNSDDCNDNLLTYVDADNDGFGSDTLAPCGVSNSDDCNDNLLTYVDADNDGFGSDTLAPCGVSNSDDCDDNDANQNALTTYYQDFDGDGFGNANVTIQSCSQPAGYVANDDDCDDNNANANQFITYYQDADGDGFGNPAVTTQSCTQPLGYVSNNSDCNDSLLTYVDNDNDGYGSSVLAPCGVTSNNDCNDNNASVYPLTLTTLDQNIYAANVNGAQVYRFRITDTSNGQVQTIDKALRVFKLTQLANYAYNKQYTVEVSVRINNVFGPYSNVVCGLITPIVTTKLQTSQCGITLTNMTTILYANLVPHAAGYRFRITNVNNPNEVHVLDRPLREVRMNQFSGVQGGTTYSVEVAVKNVDGTYLPYGEACNVTTPSTTGKINNDVIEKAFTVTVAPNPFVDSFFLRMENATDEKVSIIVYDLMGRQMETRTFNANDLENITLGRDYPTGVYTIILSIGDEVKNIRIVKR